jgi:hypothetical protein
VEDGAGPSSCIVLAQPACVRWPFLFDYNTRIVGSLASLPRISSSCPSRLTSFFQAVSYCLNPTNQISTSPRRKYPSNLPERRSSAVRFPCRLLPHMAYCSPLWTQDWGDGLLTGILHRCNHSDHQLASTSVFLCRSSIASLEVGGASVLIPLCSSQMSRKELRGRIGNG